MAGLVTQQVGSLTEEALRLLAALQGPPLGRPAAGEGSERGDDGGGDGEHCMVCRLVTALRETRPEVVAHLEDAAVSLLDALQALRSAGGAGAGPGAAPPDPGAPPARRLETIEIT